MACKEGSRLGDSSDAYACDGPWLEGLIKASIKALIPVSTSSRSVLTFAVLPTFASYELHRVDQPNFSLWLVTAEKK
jgi:hypothetical protein